jgi:hypothetical protein
MTDSTVNFDHKLLTVHDTQHHIALAENIRDVKLVRVRTAVNDAIEIEVEMIKLGQQRAVRDDFVNFGIALRYPSVKLAKMAIKMVSDTACARIQHDEAQTSVPCHPRNTATESFCRSVHSTNHTFGTPIVVSINYNTVQYNLFSKGFL